MAATLSQNLFTFYLSALRDLGRALTLDARHAQASRPLHESLYRLLGTFAVGRGALLLWDKEEKALHPAAVKGIKQVRGAIAYAPKARGLKLLAGGVRPFHPQIPPGGIEALPEEIFALFGRAQTQWVVPLGTGTEFVGLALLGPRISGDPLKAMELDVLEEMASVIALRIEDARARRRLDTQVRQLQKQSRQMRQIYMETVRALAGVIDGPEEDGRPGHSARVAALASEMGRRLKLSAQNCERLYLAGLLHDIGKQIISREVLEKKEPLAGDERRSIEEHPVAGCELISHLNFPWGDVAEIIRHHHERIDGKGYPDRLLGDQISLEAKILMMAEAFDSMTSEQPWRPRLALEKICEQISRNLGLQFEPRVVQALIDAVVAGLDGKATQPDFVPHLESAFDPALIKTMLGELRRQIEKPKRSAVIIETVG